MLQRDEAGGSIHLSLHAFILDVEVADNGPSSEVIINKICDALAWVEGCGAVNVGYLGPLDPEVETGTEASVKGTL